MKRVCLHKTRADLERANKEIERLRDQVEKLKQELSAERQPPKWAKENKPTDNEGTRITKKKGEQARQGHAPQSRKEIPEIDERVVIFPERCPEHGHELPFPSDSKWYSHIQIDLPEPQKISTTEYVVGSSYCTRCKKYHGADWGRVSGSLYGPRLHATVSYWKFQLGLTLGKMQGLLKSQYGLEISTGQISEILSRTAEKFSDSYEDLKTNISSEAHLYADETGWRVDGISSWLWSFSSPVMSVYVIDRSRGRKVVSDILGKSYSGVLHTDFYGSYNEIECKKTEMLGTSTSRAQRATKKAPKEF